MIEYTYNDYLKYQKYKREIQNTKKKIKANDEIIDTIKQGKVEETIITVRERLLKNNERIISQGIRQGSSEGLSHGIIQGKKQERERIIIKITKKMINMKMKDEDIKKLQD